MKEKILKIVNDLKALRITEREAQISLMSKLKEKYPCLNMKTFRYEVDKFLSEASGISK